MKKLALICLALMLLLSGCRVRTTAVRSGENKAPGNSITDGMNTAEGETVYEEGSTRTEKSEKAERREYDVNASADINPQAAHAVYDKGEGEGSGAFDSDGTAVPSQVSDDARKTATHVIPSDSAERAGTSEDAAPADTVLAYYRILLEERAGSLFECQRGYVYFETADDLVTVHKSSEIYRSIIGAGAYCVSSRLTTEGLTVNAGWVCRKEPDVIVKAVDSSVLGAGIDTGYMAENVLKQLRVREGWNDIPAFRNGSVIIISDEMLQNPSLTVAAQLYIAKAASPAAFKDIDPGEALKALMTEAGIQDGIYVYIGEKR